ncbi:hypothetical protein FCR2A7T_04340 [Flavobacterium cauense R2A-7]|nr:hypothetical protein FCR2A7T_04340 [Flavobacterium cauense R2A-7]
MKNTIHEKITVISPNSLLFGRYLTYNGLSKKLIIRGSTVAIP